MRQNIQAICLDLFNTLVDVGKVPESVGRFTADILGIDRKSWNQLCFSPLHQIRSPSDLFENILCLAQSVKPDISIELVEQAARERQARFNHALIHVDPVVLHALQGLKSEGISLALVSNASSSEVAAWEESPLSGLFDVVKISCHCGYAKPEPEIYTAAISELNCFPAEALFVGDGGSDEHFGAHQVGLHPVLTHQFLDEAESRQRSQHYREVLAGEINALGDLTDGKWINV